MNFLRFQNPSTHLDAFTRQYLETALWSTNDESTDQGGEPMDKNYSIHDFDKRAIEQAIRDCRLFRAYNTKDIADAEAYGKSETDIAHDFWLTRNRHGVGFWETPDYPKELGKRLTASAHQFGEVNLYVGDDGKIHDSVSDRFHNPLERFFINPIKGDFIHAGRTFQASSLIEALKQAKKEWPLADAVRVHFSDKHDETIVLKPGWFK
jgi:hypothetical protein